MPAVSALPAITRGLASTARTITCAALIMVAVFSGFMFGQDPLAKMMGLGLATAIAIDATIVRLVLVPATMTLLGKANWWLPAGSTERCRVAAPGPSAPTRPRTTEYASVSSSDPGERGDEHHRLGSSFVGAHLSELRQCRSTQLGQVGAQLGDGPDRKLRPTTTTRPLTGTSDGESRHPSSLRRWALAW